MSFADISDCVYFLFRKNCTGWVAWGVQQQYTRSGSNCLFDCLSRYVKTVFWRRGNWNERCARCGYKAFIGCVVRVWNKDFIAALDQGVQRGAQAILRASRVQHFFGRDYIARSFAEVSSNRFERFGFALSGCIFGSSCAHRRNRLINYFCRRRQIGLSNGQHDYLLSKA